MIAKASLGRKYLGGVAYLKGWARFSYDELHMAIVEIEVIINSRRLSYVHPDDLEQPLTPSHIIVGHRLLSLPDHLTHPEPPEDENF